jgi:hypothetical protein
MKHHAFDCPLGCGARMNGGEVLLNHLFDPECPNVPINCNDCKTQTTLDKKLRCAEKLHGKIKELQAQLRQQMIEKMELQAQM